MPLRLALPSCSPLSRPAPASLRPPLALAPCAPTLPSLPCLPCQHRLLAGAQLRADGRHLARPGSPLRRRRQAGRRQERVRGGAGRVLGERCGCCPNAGAVWAGQREPLHLPLACLLTPTLRPCAPPAAAWRLTMRARRSGRSATWGTACWRAPPPLPPPWAEASGACLKSRCKGRSRAAWRVRGGEGTASGRVGRWSWVVEKTLRCPSRPSRHCPACCPTSAQARSRALARVCWVQWPTP